MVISKTHTPVQGILGARLIIREIVGWLEPVARYTGMAEWLPSWNRNGDVHRDTEPYLHWNALCQSYWVSRFQDKKKKKPNKSKVKSNQKIKKYIQKYIYSDSRDENFFFLNSQCPIQIPILTNTSLIKKPTFIIFLCLIFFLRKIYNQH